MASKQQFNELKEKAFRRWYSNNAQQYGLNPNPDDPQHFYDYRAAYDAGARPDSSGHWPSAYKLEGHPRMVLEGVNTKTGQRVSQPKPKVDVLQQAMQQQPAQPVLYGGYPMDTLSSAFTMQESSGGKNMGPRYEPGFQRLYGKKYETEMYPDLFAKMLAKYGPEKVYASYGAHQVMWPVAVELGFRGEPPELADDKLNRLYFEKKFLRDWKATKGDFDTTVMRYNGRNPDYVRQLKRYLPPLEQQP